MAGYLAYIIPIDAGAHPEHPIVIPPGPIKPPEKPPGIWGGANEPFPTPPIVIPPDKPNAPPLLIWGGGNQPFPTPPIQLPGQPAPPEGGNPVKLVEWRTAWTQNTGWIVVGIPQVPHPAPAR